MKILITVGTTSFLSLIENSLLALNKLENDGYFIDVVIQCPQSEKIKTKYKKYDYINNINYADFDIVITHAGAGSVYNLLERKIKCVVVPNIDRIDTHQLEIAKYIDDNKYCEVVIGGKTIYDSICNIINGVNYFEYRNDFFFKKDEILCLIK